METINGKVNNSNKIKTYAEGNNSYISPSSNSYLGNIKTEVETIDFDTDNDIESEETVKPKQYSDSIWNSSDNLADYLSSHGFNISAEDISNYGCSYMNGKMRGNVIAKGKCYLISQDGIEVGFNARYSYDKEGEYSFKIDDILYSKDTLATFLISKGIISSPLQIATYYNNGDNTGGFFLKDGHFGKITDYGIIEDHYNYNKTVNVNSLMYDKNKLAAYLKYKNVIANENEIASYGYDEENEACLWLKNGDMYYVTIGGLEKKLDVNFHVDSFDEDDEYAFKLDDIMYSKDTLTTFLKSKGIINDDEEILTYTNNHSSADFYLSNGRYFFVFLNEADKTVSISELRNLKNNYISLMDDTGYYSYINNINENYGGSQMIFQSDDGYSQLLDKNNYYYDEYIASGLKKLFPNASMEEYVSYLEKICNTGCGYVAFANSVFKSFEGKEKQFENIFGYPMYRENSGKKYYNTYRLAFDAFNYIWAEASDYTLEQIVYGDDNINENNNNPVQLGSDGGGGTWDSMQYLFKDFMKEKYNFDIKVEVDRDVSADDLNTKIEEYSKIGYNVVAGTKGYNLYDMDDTLSYSNGGGHAMSVTNVTDDGNIIVSTWGNSYVLDVSDVESNDGIISLNCFKVDVPTVIPKSKESLQKEFITGFEDKLNHRNNINLGE